MKSMFVAQTLVQKGYRIFSAREFQRLFRASKTAATFFLFRHARDGLFVKLKNGLYTLSHPFPSEEEIANRLYQPSYLSLEYVLARHGIIPEAVYAVTSITTKPSREFTVEKKIYTYQTVKKSFYFGFESQQKTGTTILTATPEKALVDTLYFVSLKKKRLNDRLNLKPLSKKIVLDYAKRFGRPKLLALVRELL